MQTAHVAYKLGSVLGKDADADKATMKINTNGLLKLEFEGSNWSSRYFFANRVTNYSKGHLTWDESIF